MRASQDRAGQRVLNTGFRLNEGSTATYHKPRCNPRFYGGSMGAQRINTCSVRVSLIQLGLKFGEVRNFALVSSFHMQESARESENYSSKANSYNEILCRSRTVSPGENAAMSRLQLKGLEKCLHLRRGIGERGVESMSIS